jgi:hypothetical protein
MKIKWNEVTWYSKLIALTLFIVLVYGGFWLGVGYGQMVQRIADVPMELRNAPAQATSSAVGLDPYYSDVTAWRTDGNNSSFSIAYPLDFDTQDNLTGVGSADWTVSDLGQSGVKEFSLTIPRAFEPQTNFEDATLTVGSSGDSGAVVNCLDAFRFGGGSLSTSSVSINGADFTVIRGSDAGAGNLYDTTSYRTLHAGQCWAIEYTIHSSQIANYPPEYQLKPFDKTKLTDVLDRIVGTFKFE